MMLEYWLFDDSANAIANLYEGLRFEKQAFIVEIRRVERIRIERKYARAQFDAQEMTRVIAYVIEKGKEKEAQIFFRHKSKIAIIETDNGILVADAIYEVLTDDLKINLISIEPSREKIRDFLSNVGFIDVRVETWQGERSIAELEEVRGDPILKYGMSSARIELECEGKITLKITLDYMHSIKGMTPVQKECAIELLETYFL